MTNYKVAVKTANELGSGTDADVGIILVGDLGRSDELVLHDEYKNTFERNKVRLHKTYIFHCSLNVFQVESEASVAVIAY